VMVHQVNIADKLHFDGLSIVGFQRQILVTDVFVILQYLESVLGCGNIFEYPEFPNILVALSTGDLKKSSSISFLYASKPL